MTRRPRLLLVEDHHLMLEGLRLALADDYEIAGMLSTGTPVAAACRELLPDAVLLDLSLPDRSGLEVITDVCSAMPESRILVVTMHSDRVLADAALQAGALGFIPKDAEVAELRLAVEEVLAGRQFVSPLVAQQGPQYSPRDLAFGLARLTPRQREIVRLLGEGKSSARIAAELHVSANTVTFHRVRARKALGIETEWGLTRYAILVRMAEGR